MDTDQIVINGDDIESSFMIGDKSQRWNHPQDSYSASVLSGAVKRSIKLMLMSRLLCNVAVCALFMARVVILHDKMDYSVWNMAAAVFMFNSAVLVSWRALGNVNKIYINRTTYPVPSIMTCFYYTMFNIAISGIVMSNLVYWHIANQHNRTTLDSVTHIVMLLACIAELLLSATPVHLVDVYQPFLYSAIYVLYSYLGGQLISFDILFFVVCGIVIITIYLLIYSIVFVKLKVLYNIKI
ncbi:hypothetical protein [Perigonia lusca single nucleopolyhedrovirus]|uniref:Uncharacterized protein n=1 Tax=Perigonia lusca single nucleopolyhedrovirus TaxID=1675865 RepID=A0A0M3WNP3_9ABAC|nr:hypothetical protein [Perigonia lusca single nucleopolyhedrovirus]AKN80680.1 hypothetical protein [Perigonia lusca single nucleopolyhedrovirus]